MTKKTMCTLTTRSIAALLGAALVTSSARAQTPNGGAVGPPPSVPAATDYRLTPGDKLRVEVYKDAQLSQSLQVRPDGKITLPLIGDIVASDLTPIELRDRSRPR